MGEGQGQAGQKVEHDSRPCEAGRCRSGPGGDRADPDRNGRHGGRAGRQDRRQAPGPPGGRQREGDRRGQGQAASGRAPSSRRTRWPRRRGRRCLRRPMPPDVRWWATRRITAWRSSPSRRFGAGLLSGKGAPDGLVFRPVGILSGLRRNHRQEDLRARVGTHRRRGRPAPDIARSLSASSSWRCSSKAIFGVLRGLADHAARHGFADSPGSGRVKSALIRISDPLGVARRGRLGAAVCQCPGAWRRRIRRSGHAGPEPGGAARQPAGGRTDGDAGAGDGRDLPALRCHGLRIMLVDETSVLAAVVATDEPAGAWRCSSSGSVTGHVSIRSRLTGR